MDTCVADCIAANEDSDPVRSSASSGFPVVEAEQAAEALPPNDLPVP